MLIAPWRLATGLLDASKSFGRAQKRLAAGALKDARYQTLTGAAAAARARAGFESNSPLLDVAAAIPEVGDALGEVGHLVDAAGYSARAAVGTLEIAQSALRGPDRIVAQDPEDPTGSFIRLDRIEAVGETISNVHANVGAASRALEAVNLDKLPSRARRAIKDGTAKARKTRAVLSDAVAGFKILPGVLGANGPRTYLLGMQNSAELRGTGGAILQYQLLKVDEGRLELLPTETVYKVDVERQTLDIPLPADAWYVRGIVDAQRFGNANWSPDWPLSAKLTLAYARAAEKTFPDVVDFPERIDGVIGVDPIAMQQVMRGVGAYKTKKSRHRITAKNVVPFVLYKAYASYPIPGRRRFVLREVVDGFYEGLINPERPTELAQGLGRALSAKDMQIWLARRNEQAFLERMKWSGAITDIDDEDYLYVVEQNVGGNKLDYYAQQTDRVFVKLFDGDATVSTEVSIKNGVFLPQPRWAMGDTGSVASCQLVGTCPVHRPMVNVYVPRSAQLLRAFVRGTRLDSPEPAAWLGGRPPEHIERGKKVWSATLQIPPRAKGSVRFDYRVPGAVRTVGNKSVYRLVLQHQPKIHPERLVVHVALPAGATDVTAPGFERRGGSLVWDRLLDKDTVLRVAWRS